MEEKSYLAYVNAKVFSFKYTDFNFDSKYLFELEVNNEEYNTKYILHISKRQGIVQPEGFWGNNICSVSALIGQNGSGKTSFFRVMMNHVGSGLTAMNGEFIVYIVCCNGVYVVYDNSFPSIVIDKSEDAQDINIYTENEYFAMLRQQEGFKPPFDNRRFWKNIIFFSNHFGTLSMRNNEYIINVSKDEEIGDAIKQLKTIDELHIEPLANIYKRYRDLKLIQYFTDATFQLMASKCRVSLPNLLKFNIRNNEDYNEYLNADKFPHKKWIGVHRYEIYSYDNNVYEYEAALNKLAVYLMIGLMNEASINEDTFQKFLVDLSETNDKTGTEIALEYLYAIGSESVLIWIKLLEFVNDKSSNKDLKFVLSWQGDKEFCCRWEDADIELIKQVLSMNTDKMNFSVDLVGSEQNGFYSSGEESKLSVFLSMYEALKRIEKEENNDTFRGNLIILLDEIDAFFHPKYQINIVSEVLEIISKGFEEYNVQIIIASNTPLELSDFPSSNIIYLEEGRVVKNQNEVVTFGSNVCSLLKNQFYINTTMGAFAKKKIDGVIKFLTDEGRNDISKEEAKYIISIVGEPIIKKKLQEMYDEKFPFENGDSKEQIEYYKRKTLELQEKIKSTDKIDNSTLDSLEEVLQKFTEIIRSVKE